MWNLVSVHSEMVLVLVQEIAWLAPDVPYASNLFWMPPMVLLGDEAQVESHFGSFRDSANLDSR
jgi:hypothetical protein